MSLSSEGEELRDRFLAVLLEAAELLRDRLRQELAELRQEQVD